MNKLKVLVVDDNHSNRSLYSIILKDKYEVLTAKTVEEAKEQFDNNNNNISSIFLDLNLEGGLDENLRYVPDGLEFAKYVRKEKGFYTPIFALTALDKHIFENQALEAGCDFYINIPIQPDYMRALASVRGIFIAANPMLN